MAVNATQQRADALLHWVNSFPLDSPVLSLQQLNDGHALAQVLANFDSSFEATGLINTSNATNWIPRWENLKLVNKALSRYIREECAESTGLNLSQNLKRIAEHADLEELVQVQSLVGNPLPLLTYDAEQLISVLLLACVLGPNAAQYIEKIMASEHAAMLAAIIQEKQDEDAKVVKRLPTENDVSAPSNTQAVDIDLALEERHGELIAKNAALEREIKKIKERNADLLTRSDKFQLSSDDFKARYLAAEDKNAELSNKLDISNPEIIHHLEEKIQEQEILITSQEREIADIKTTKESIQRELNTLRPVASESKDLRAEVADQKYEIEELTKKANAMERYKQKLESQKHLEPENSRLKTQVTDLCQESAKLQSEVEQFKKLQSQYTSTLSNQEVELFEIRSQKDTIEYEKRQLQQELETAAVRAERDALHITELTERLTAGSPPSNVESPTKSTHMDLQAEMDEAEPRVPDLEMEIARLRDTNTLLRGGLNVTQEKFELEAALAEATRLRNLIEKKFHIQFEEHVLLQKQLSAIIEGRAKEGYVSSLTTDVENALKVGKMTWLTSEFYSNDLGKTYKDLSMRLSEEIQVVKKKVEILEYELGNKNREILDLKAELSMVDQDEIEKIDIVRSTNASLISNLQSDYKSLHARYQTLLDESTIQKSQLTEALLSKDTIRNERDDLTTLVSTLKTGKPGSSEEEKEELKTQNAKIKELQDKLKKYVERGNGNEIKTEKDEEIMNLRRENTLMATAWYDLTTRIQSNNIALQRRSDTPKSWINKHRQAALGTMPRR